MKIGAEFPGSATGWAGILWFGLLQGSAWSQVVVTNGLSHFQRGSSQEVGYIELWNPSQERHTALLILDSLLGPMNDLQIASEVPIPPETRVRVNYRWLSEDSSSQGVRIFVSTAAQAAAPEVQAGRVLVQISTRYAVDLYRGQLCEELDLVWSDRGIRVTNQSKDFWAGSCYAIRNGERYGRSLSGGVLRPGDSRVWQLPEDSEGAWLENTDGVIVASRRP
ncbi:MAG: hypothetical protein HQ466_04275 [Cryomorphaceae bacterium]|nr:hypothetical protein [Cryomorphaceae bacterium]